VRALISVWDKEGLDRLATGLADLGWELVASGGTAAYLEELGLECDRVEDLTEVPEMLGGRVKTLHPRIHAAILARRDRDDDVATLEQHEIAPFDLVVVNLYPFARDIEMIDVGGPAMLRAAAKNFAHVTVVCDPADYERVLSELPNGVAEKTRKYLAQKVFDLTARYDARIANWLGDPLPIRDRLMPVLEKEMTLAYGENPHQAAAYFTVAGGGPHLLDGVEKVHGRDLSFINLYDLAAARTLLAELGDEPACVIVKHANPCGAAVAASIEEAYERAYAGDPLSAFGMVCVLNRPVSRALGEELAEQFVDVLYASSYDEAALGALTRKPATRILAGPALELTGALDAKHVPGGFLVQPPDVGIEPREEMDAVCGPPTEEQWRDLLFAWTVCKHVTSNAIVLAKEQMTVGIGAGQQSRVDAVRLALDKAGERVHDLRGAVLASDAFFPFADGPGLALEAGIRAIIQPGGSKRDGEVIDAVQRAGAAMVFTGRRHFRH
jgi:phosphoribosylaminoimidazolecarboxamide formyltransferase / IMP cyclohydrolase